MVAPQVFVEYRVGVDHLPLVNDIEYAWVVGYVV